MDKAVTVVLPVFNGERFLATAVKSILEQTVANFECIVIDDGSTDSSFDILNELCDERFLILRRKKNQGLVAALNLGIERAETELVARMDADDIMHPQRLAFQIGFMMQNPHIAVSGTYFEYINVDDETVGDAIQFPVQPEDVRASFRSFVAIGSSTVMFRKSLLIKYTGLCSVRYPHAEDLGLWLECLSKGLLLANLPEVLLKCRQYGGQVENRRRIEQRQSTELAYQDFADLIWKKK